MWRVQGTGSLNMHARMSSLQGNHSHGRCMIAPAAGEGGFLAAMLVEIRSETAYAQHKLMAA